MALYQLNIKDRDAFMKKLLISTTFDIVDSKKPEPTKSAQILRLPTVLVLATSQLLSQTHSQDPNRLVHTLQSLIASITNKNTTNNKQAQTSPNFTPNGITFSQQTVKLYKDLFGTYVRWIYTGKVPRSQSCNLHTLWTFGLVMGAPAYQNAVITSRVEASTWIFSAADVLDMRTKPEDRPYQIFSPKPQAPPPSTKTRHPFLNKRKSSNFLSPSTAANTTTMTNTHPSQKKNEDYLKLWTLAVDYVAHLGPSHTLFTALKEIDEQARVRLMAAEINETYKDNWRVKREGAGAAGNALLKPGVRSTHPFAECNKWKYLVELPAVEI